MIPLSNECFNGQIIVLKGLSTPATNDLATNILKIDFKQIYFQDTFVMSWMRSMSTIDGTIPWFSECVNGQIIVLKRIIVCFIVCVSTR